MDGIGRLFVVGWDDGTGAPRRPVAAHICAAPACQMPWQFENGRAGTIASEPLAPPFKSPPAHFLALTFCERGARE